MRELPLAVGFPTDILSNLMIYLHKLGPLLISPLFLAIAMVAIGVLTSRKWICVLAMAFLYAVSTPIVADYLIRFAEGHAVRQHPESVPRADAIVVLSGFVYPVQSSDGIYSEWTDPDRFMGGMELARLGKANLLIFTGGQVPWQRQALPEGQVLSKLAQSMGVPADHILVTDEVENTEQEARAVRKLLPDPKASILLVTSAFHMPRAQAMFERVGLSVIPYPVDFKVEVRSLTPMDFFPKPISLQTSDIAIREQIGRLYYLIRNAFAGGSVA